MVLEETLCYQSRQVWPPCHPPIVTPFPRPRGLQQRTDASRAPTSSSRPGPVGIWHVIQRIRMPCALDKRLPAATTDPTQTSSARARPAAPPPRLALSSGRVFPRLKLEHLLNVFLLHSPPPPPSIEHRTRKRRQTPVGAVSRDSWELHEPSSAATLRSSSCKARATFSCLLQSSSRRSSLFSDSGDRPGGADIGPSSGSNQTRKCFANGSSGSKDFIFRAILFETTSPSFRSPICRQNGELVLACLATGRSCVRPPL
jgi:hypothetical protein